MYLAQILSKMFLWDISYAQVGIKPSLSKLNGRVSAATIIKKRFPRKYLLMPDLMVYEFYSEKTFEDTLESLL